MVGDADKYNIGYGARHLLTVPARWAFFLAGNRANAITQMFDTPARLALSVFFAWVEKAPLSRRAFGRKLDGNLVSRLYQLEEINNLNLRLRHPVGRVDHSRVGPSRISMPRSILGDGGRWIAASDQDGYGHAGK